MDSRPLPPALRCVICGNGEGKDVDSCPLQLLMGHCGGANRNGQPSDVLFVGMVRAGMWTAVHSSSY